MSKFKYNIGDLLGPKQLKLLARTSKNTRNEWFGEFICPECGNKFEAIISKIASGHTKSCGCLVKKDLTNERFGRLVALYENGRTKNGTVKWHCRCDCGNEVDIASSELRAQKNKSCGCLRSDLKALDLTQQRFGHLVALSRTNEKTAWGNFLWTCECDCGKVVNISSSSLVSGNSQTCGSCHYASLQEEKIATILQALDINFEQQKTFLDCRNPKTNRLLKFDFYLPQYNLLIEYDGEQHFHYSNSENTWNTKEQFLETQYRDNVKNQYCLTHNIPLIRIPYTQKMNISKEFLLNLILTHERTDAEE